MSDYSPLVDNRSQFWDTLGELHIDFKSLRSVSVFESHLYGVSYILSCHLASPFHSRQVLFPKRCF